MQRRVKERNSRRDSRPFVVLEGEMGEGKGKGLSTYGRFRDRLQLQVRAFNKGVSAVSLTSLSG